MEINTKNSSVSLQKQLQNDIQSFIAENLSRFPEDELLKIDLHCHDCNSDVPDELLGRILNVPETWLDTDRLIENLKKNNMDVITVTNHNNARTCWELMERGIDVLAGAEFSCYVPDYKIGIHVLAYGFSREQELMLEKLRRNIYQFLEYTCNENIPTIWAHPLYYYSSNGLPPYDFFCKMALVFERFEVINGHRDSLQNMLVKVWLESITPQDIDLWSEKFNMNPHLYCKDIYRKAFAGGSDSHMGIFAGQTGSYLHIPNLKQRLHSESKTQLALEAIREGRFFPFGTHNNNEKLTVSLLDYVFQLALYMKDPGMLRILLHKGNYRDKIIAFLVYNALAEVRRHKTTMKFIRLFHECFRGKVPSFNKKILVPKTYKPIFLDAVKMAKTGKNNLPNLVQVYKNNIFSIHQKLNTILYTRLYDKLTSLNNKGAFETIDFQKFIRMLEIPSEIRRLIKPDKRKKHLPYTNIDLLKFLDGLPFPFLASLLILAANYISAKAMYNNRSLTNMFSEITGKYKHPQRMLWLTDSFDDSNGVSVVLKSFLKEIQDKNLAIDILTCSNHLQSEDHFIVIKPELEFALPFYSSQPLRIPNFLTIHEIFQKGEYDRIMCSTEGSMGFAAIYLKNAFSVPAYFYIHTDWVMFARKVLNIQGGDLNRLRRFLRAYYKQFDKLFVLNTDQQKWLCGKHMGFKPENVLLTAHWVDDVFRMPPSVKIRLDGVNENDFVLLYSGRLSKEKGIFELPEIYYSLKNNFKSLKIVIAGSGPDEMQLKQLLPDAIYLGWIDHKKLRAVYASANMLLLPSKFDTFSCSVLEALSCGLPVVAYNIKGPKDIISNHENGFLVRNISEFISCIAEYISKPHTWDSFREKALLCAQNFNKNKILQQLLSDIGLR